MSRRLTEDDLKALPASTRWTRNPEFHGPTWMELQPLELATLRELLSSELDGPDSARRDQALEDLTPEHFADPVHQNVFRLLRECRELPQYAAPDMAILMFHAITTGRRGEIEKHGSTAWLWEVADAPGCRTLLEGYVAALCHHFRVRQDRERLVQATVALDEGRDYQEPLRDLGDYQDSSLWARYERTAPQAIEDLTQPKEDVGEPVDTGFGDLDQILGPMRPGGMYVLMGAPGHGKSLISLCIARWCIRVASQRVLLFNAEMDAADLMGRILAAEGGVPVRELQDWLRGGGGPGGPASDQLLRVVDAWREVRERLVISYKAGITLSQVYQRALQHHRADPLNLVVLDYLQRVQPDSSNRSEPRHAQVAKMSSRLKDLFMRLKVPGLVLAQPNRAWLSDRTLLGPQLHHLAESKVIGDDADAVITVSDVSQLRPDNADVRGLMRVEVVKNRRGRLGSCWLRWNKPLCLLEDADPEEWPEVS